MTDYNFDFFMFCILFLYTEDWKYRKGEDARRRQAEDEIRGCQREQLDAMEREERDIDDYVICQLGDDWQDEEDEDDGDEDDEDVSGVFGRQTWSGVIATKRRE